MVISLFVRLKNYFLPDKQLAAQLQLILGFKPKHLPFYQLALAHKSKVEELTHNNERLEFLGDAYLGAIVGEYLFKKYPMQSEGFLTELRSKIVRRQSLDHIAHRMGLHKIVQHNLHGNAKSHIFGNALEALVGAIYLDQGYKQTEKFIIHQIIKAYVDIENLAQTDTNYKNQLIVWAQLQKKQVAFEVKDSTQKEKRRRIFTVAVLLEEQIICEGTAFNKKDAGQVAAKKALELLTGKSMLSIESLAIEHYEQEPETPTEPEHLEE